MKAFVVLSALPMILASAVSANVPRPPARPMSLPITPALSAAPSVTPSPVAAPTSLQTKRHRRHSSHRHSTGDKSAIAAANRAATLAPTAHGFINAEQVYPYASGLVFQVMTAPERVTDIALQPGEQLVAVASGDTVRWIIGDTTSGAGGEKRTHILVKPFAPGLSTNLVVTTDRRSYHIALTSTAGAAMAALSWTYPQDALLALKRAEVQAAAVAPIATGLDVDQLRFDYTITGDRPAWRPLRAFDDGRQTFIEFPATLAVGEAPPLFLVDGKGEAQLVNYRLHGHFYIVDRLFDLAELRLGTKRQDIVRISRAASATGRRS